MGLKARRAQQTERRLRERRSSYTTFQEIDGSHDWRAVAPDAHVDYRAWRRTDGKVVYFNFELAKEIGLINNEHPHNLNSRLEEEILGTFALQIINEFDIAKKVPVPLRRVQPNPYMATRYLQLQHSDKSGRTSGDGRSVWNGSFRRKGITWDFSSCGTGVTCLSPGVVAAGKPIKTGSGSYSYGSGLAGLDEGISGAILSEILHRLGTQTERTLAVIEFPGATAVTVRASKNLLRPSHLFAFLKQEKHAELCSSLDYFIRRQVQNDAWRIEIQSKDRYRQMLTEIANRYAQFAADLEDNYIFCWMDWDGDNMLAAGGIIDYGSIRHFGLRHDEYRFDDVERWSTNLNQQRAKARYIVQTFAQLVDFAETGKRRRIEDFRDHWSVRDFDKQLNKSRDRLLMRRMGLNQNQMSAVEQSHMRAFRNWEKNYRWFERRKSKQGRKKTSDGENRAAIYAIREILNLLPKHLFEKDGLMDAKAFIKAIQTPYCSLADTKASRRLRAKVRAYQESYLQLLRKISPNLDRRKKTLSEMIMRASQKNFLDPITGDGVLYVTDRILRTRHRFSNHDVHALIENLIREKTERLHEYSSEVPKLSPSAQRILDGLLEIAEEYKHSI